MEIILAARKLVNKKVKPRGKKRIKDAKKIKVIKDEFICSKYNNTVPLTPLLENI